MIDLSLRKNRDMNADCRLIKISTESIKVEQHINIAYPLIIYYFKDKKT